MSYPDELGVRHLSTATVDTQRASARPLRIAMVGLRGIPATHGGIEGAVEALATRLAARGHDVTVYARRSYSLLAPPATAA